MAPGFASFACVLYSHISNITHGITYFSSKRRKKRLLTALKALFSQVHMHYTHLDSILTIKSFFLSEVSHSNPLTPFDADAATLLRSSELKDLTTTKAVEDSDNNQLSGLLTKGATYFCYP